MDIYTETGLIGLVIQGLTQNVTGSLFLTLLMIVTMFVLIMLLFRIPVEFQAVIIAPMLFTLMAYTREFLAIGGVILIFMAIVFARMISK